MAKVELMVGHLDTTSFHVDGRYNSDDDEDFDEGRGLIRVRSGVTAASIGATSIR
jgi:hypothetical protein